MTADEEDIATGKSDEDRGEGVDQQLIVQLHCVTKRNTWSHQRRKRRLMEKLQVQQSATSQGDCSFSDIIYNNVIFATLQSTAHDVCAPHKQYNYY